MIEIEKIYKLLTDLKGWPVHEAKNLNDASHMILGSPYWKIPKDIYQVIDKNDVYCLLAVYSNGNASHFNRYLAVNMSLNDRIEPVREADLLNDMDSEEIKNNE